MRSRESAELLLTYEDLDTLMAALDMASLHTPPGSLYRHPGIVGAWRKLERRFGEILTTDLDDMGPAEMDDGTYTSAPPACSGGFVWIGQTLASCDDCGRPSWEHAGWAISDQLTSPFDDPPLRLEPFKPGEADRLRARYETPPA